MVPGDQMDDHHHYATLVDRSYHELHRRELNSEDDGCAIGNDFFLRTSQYIFYVGGCHD